MAGLNKAVVSRSVSLPRWCCDLIEQRLAASAAVKTFSGVLTDLLLESKTVAAYVDRHGGSGSGNGKPPADRG